MGSYRSDSRLPNWKLVTFNLFLAFYIISFTVIHSRVTSYDCGVMLVDFPSGLIRTFYRPLISIEKFLLDDAVYTGDGDDTRYAEHYYCGE
jgi:hypothetical protein